MEEISKALYWGIFDCRQGIEPLGGLLAQRRHLRADVLHLIEDRRHDQHEREARDEEEAAQDHRALSYIDSVAEGGFLSEEGFYLTFLIKISVSFLLIRQKEKPAEHF